MNSRHQEQKSDEETEIDLSDSFLAHEHAGLLKDLVDNDGPTKVSNVSVLEGKEAEAEFSKAHMLHTHSQSVFANYHNSGFFVVVAACRLSHFIHTLLAVLP